MPYLSFINWLKKMVGLYVEPKPLGISLTALKRHVYISGRSGSGKSELMKLLFYTLQKQSQKNLGFSLVLLDPHGDLAEEVLGFHLNASTQKNGQSSQDRIIYIDLYADTRQIPIINPLELPRQITNGEEKEAMIDLLSQELARIFQEMIAGTTLSLQMEALLVPCIQ